MRTLILKNPEQLKEWRKSISNKSIGFVPTMGALHDGHSSLLRASKEQNDLTILSIFVNKTQFNNLDDLSRYPRTFQEDLQRAELHKVDVVFSPDYPSLYPDDYHYRVQETVFSQKLCGEHRPGHFEGVLTVVLKLFNLALPTRAYFGEKDFQQLSLIKKMVEAFFLPLEVISIPTVRETSGLAMSSRNIRLSEEERQIAPRLYQIIKSFPKIEAAKNELQAAGFEVEYLTDHEDRRYVAAKLGNVRLIDNVEV